MDARESSSVDSAVATESVAYISSYFYSPVPHGVCFMRFMLTRELTLRLLFLHPHPSFLNSASITSSAECGSRSETHPPRREPGAEAGHCSHRRPAGHLRIPPRLPAAGGCPGHGFGQRPAAEGRQGGGAQQQGADGAGQGGAGHRGSRPCRLPGEYPLSYRIFIEFT